MLHPCQRLKAFNRTTKEGKAPKTLNGDQVYEKVKQNTVNKNV